MSLRNCSRISGLLTAFLLGSVAAHSQSTLSGTVKDAQTGEPVPYANVFFSHTTMGSSTLEDGAFTIHRIPNGKYDLMVFVVGYKRYKLPVEFQESNYKLDIVLDQDTINLKAVTIVADQSDKKYYPIFEKYFLGETENSKECKFMNPETLRFFYDQKSNVLYVHATDPLVVVNRALGYKLIFILDIFQLDYKTSIKITEGIPRYEELPFRSRRDSISRVKRRLEAYHGSLNHFMRSLFSNSLKEQGFQASIVDSVKLHDYRQVERPADINTSDYVKGDLVKTFTYQGILKVSYKKESESWRYTYSRNDTHQVSFITFKNSSLTLFENGYYLDQLGVFLEGYMVWDETASNMLPIGYNVSVKQKRK